MSFGKIKYIGKSTNRNLFILINVPLKIGIIAVNRA